MHERELPRLRGPIALMLMLALLLSACSSDGASEAEGIGLEISGDGGVAEGTVEIAVTLSNESGADVTLVRPTQFPNFVSFTVTDSDGNRMPFYGPYLRLAPLGDDGFVTLAPGESTTETLDIGPGYLLDAGTYTVTATYLNPAGGSHEGTRALVFEPDDGPVSDSIEIVVTP